MTSANSPSYAAGVEDAQRDMELMSSHPGNAPIGPMPPNPAYPVMYTRGYDDTFVPTFHSTCDLCEREKAISEANNSR